jgi:hypothetical protein
MNLIWWFLIVVALILLIAYWDAFRADAVRPRSRKRAMQRLRRFEQEQRMRQQAEVMRRTREINALAHDTCQAMMQAAIEAQRRELDSYDE